MGCQSPCQFHRAFAMEPHARPCLHRRITERRKATDTYFPFAVVLEGNRPYAIDLGVSLHQPRALCKASVKLFTRYPKFRKLLVSDRRQFLLTKLQVAFVDAKRQCVGHLSIPPVVSTVSCTLNKLDPFHLQRWPPWAWRPPKVLRPRRTKEKRQPELYHPGGRNWGST